MNQLGRQRLIFPCHFKTRLYILDSMYLFFNLKKIALCTYVDKNIDALFPSPNIPQSTTFKNLPFSSQFWVLVFLIQDLIKCQGYGGHCAR